MNYEVVYVVMHTDVNTADLHPAAIFSEKEDAYKFAKEKETEGYYYWTVEEVEINSGKWW